MQSKLARLQYLTLMLVPFRLTSNPLPEHLLQARRLLQIAINPDMTISRTQPVSHHTLIYLQEVPIQMGIYVVQ